MALPVRARRLSGFVAALLLRPKQCKPFGGCGHLQAKTGIRSHSDRPSLLKGDELPFASGHFKVSERYTRSCYERLRQFAHSSSISSVQSFAEFSFSARNCI